MKLISSEGRKGKFATWVGATTIVAMLGLSACSEKLDSTAGCPTLCSGQTADIQNETFEAVVEDSSVPAYPGLGTETFMVLAARGDTVDTRLIVRFDTLPSRMRANITGTDTTTVPITYIDSTKFFIRFDSSGGTILQPVTLSLYDVETAGNDTAVAALAPLFVPGRLIGQRVFPSGTLLDTVTVALDNSFVQSKVVGGQRIRIGIQATSTVPVMVLAYSQETGGGPSMSFRVSADTARPRVGVQPRSKTPADNPYSQFSLGDFVLTVDGSPPPPAGFLAVGGLPAKRTYFRFTIPSRIVDSSIVVRATLLLTQLASTGPNAADTMRLLPSLIFAGPVVTDPARAVQIITPSSFPLATTLIRPGESLEREIEIAPVFGIWRQQTEAQLPRAIALSASREGGTAQQALFYSTSAVTASLRPRLRVSYTTRTRIGTP